MNSEETLVEGGRVDANAVFTFSRDDMRRTTISLRGYWPCYSVDSDMGFSRTTISRYGESVPLAVSEARGILPDKITFAGQERQRLRSWLKFSTLTLLYVFICGGHFAPDQCLSTVLSRLRWTERRISGVQLQMANYRYCSTPHPALTV